MRLPHSLQTGLRSLQAGLRSRTSESMRRHMMACKTRGVNTPTVQRKRGVPPRGALRSTGGLQVWHTLSYPQRCKGLALLSRPGSYCGLQVADCEFEKKRAGRPRSACLLASLLFPNLKTAIRRPIRPTRHWAKGLPGLARICYRTLAPHRTYTVMRSTVYRNAVCKHPEMSHTCLCQHDLSSSLTACPRNLVNSKFGKSFNTIMTSRLGCLDVGGKGSLPLIPLSLPALLRP